MTRCPDDRYHDGVIVTSRYLAPPGPCGYLPAETWRLEYAHVAELAPEEYGRLLIAGWRRFGRWIFRPRCPGCQACRSLRVEVAAFRPDRAQRRNHRDNHGTIHLSIGEPALTAENLDLHRRFHHERSMTRGWPDRGDDPDSYRDSFLDNPFPVEQWRFERDGRLVGLGHVDALPVGLSAIYFVHDPAEHARGLGTWNVLCLIDEARARGLPHVYLGYHVAGCPSLAYKARFRPHQLLGPDGQWHDHPGDRPGSAPAADR